MTGVYDLELSVPPVDSHSSDTPQVPAIAAMLGPRLVTIDCAAKLLGVGRTTLYEQIATGDIQVVHIGRAARVPLTSIDAFVAELQRRTIDAASVGIRRRPGSPATS